MVIGSVEAFHSPAFASPLETSTTRSEHSSSTTSLHAFKPPTLKKKTAEPPAEKIKSNNALDLIALYMTPWRNVSGLRRFLMRIRLMILSSNSLIVFDILPSHASQTVSLSIFLSSYSRLGSIAKHNLQQATCRQLKGAEGKQLGILTKLSKLIVEIRFQ